MAAIINKPSWNQAKVNSKVTIQAYKYDGSLYRKWKNASIILNNSRHIVFYLKNTKVYNKGKTSYSWLYRHDAIWFMPKDSFYNCIISFDDTGLLYYINVASKPYFEENVLKFIDFDLDIKHSSKKHLQIVDRMEFKTNFKKMKYPEKLKDIIYKEIHNIFLNYNEYKYFFSGRVLNYYVELLKKQGYISEFQAKRLRQIIKDDFVSEEDQYLKNL